MTHEGQIERLLDRWLGEGPSEAPDRVLDVVADRIERQPQWPAWRLLWRDHLMNGSARPFAAIAAIVLIAVGGVVLVGRPFDKATTGATPAATIAPASSPSAAPSASAEGWWLHGGPSCAPCLGAVPAGTHTTTDFRPRLTFTVPAGWINATDATNSFELMPDVEGNRTFYSSGWGTFQDLSADRAASVAAADCSDSNEAGVGLGAADIVGALAKRSGLDTTDPVDVTIGGLTGKQIDVAMTPSWTKTCDGYTAVPLIKYPYEGAVYHLLPGEHSRLIVLDVPASAGGGTVLITAYTRDAASFAAHIAAAMPVVNSFKFDLTAP